MFFISRSADTNCEVSFWISYNLTEVRLDDLPPAYPSFVKAISRCGRHIAFVAKDANPPLGMRWFFWKDGESFPGVRTEGSPPEASCRSLSFQVLDFAPAGEILALNGPSRIHSEVRFPYSTPCFKHLKCPKGT